MKSFARSLLPLLIVVVCVASAVAQTQLTDVVYLKNGSIIKGTILEMVPDQTVKIQTGDGSVFIFQMMEVQKVVKEQGPASVASEAVNLPGTGIVFFAGGLLPTGDLKENTGIAAKTGFTSGIQILPASPAGIILQGSYSMCKPEVNSSMSGFVADDKKWTFILATAGLKLGTRLTNSGGFYIAPIAGMLWVTPPENTIYAPSTRKGFAYGGQVGLILGRSITVFAQYVMSKPPVDDNQTTVYSFGYPVYVQEQEVKFSFVNVALGIVF